MPHLAYGKPKVYSVGMPRPTPTPEQLYLRFWSRVDKTDTCWNWTAGTYNEGYGVFVIKSQSYTVHRLSYEMEHGPIEPGLHIHHICENKLCVRPDHLEAITPGAHNGIHKRATATHCPQGHPYSEDNLAWTGPDKRWRRCRTCLREAQHRAEAKKTAQRRANPKPNPNSIKTHCPAGHEYDEANTYVWNGHRTCRTCVREKAAARRGR